MAIAALAGLALAGPTGAQVEGEGLSDAEVHAALADAPFPQAGRYSGQVRETGILLDSLNPREPDPKVSQATRQLDGFCLTPEEVEADRGVFLEKMLESECDYRGISIDGNDFTAQLSCRAGGDIAAISLDGELFETGSRVNMDVRLDNDDSYARFSYDVILKREGECS
ncbi:DUF3617 domain-containing protein [Alteraurantiacibacter aquimixticola]|uniref:DUF3617 domain-containing protein n=1 Tax=Alteraurantiacibacter aquimixticola TaxID=2489173 RepID=UPI00145BC4E3|nr:DUF3617 family protein [Alteraurantiacibacter aquimixticola]